MCKDPHRIVARKVESLGLSDYERICCCLNLGLGIVACFGVTACQDYLHFWVWLGGLLSWRRFFIQWDFPESGDKCSLHHFSLNKGVSTEGCTKQGFRPSSYQHLIIRGFNWTCLFLNCWFSLQRYKLSVRKGLLPGIISLWALFPRWTLVLIILFGLFDC
jgi:hypothetical protein